VAAREDRRGAPPAGRREVRLESTAVLDDLARARARLELSQANAISQIVWSPLGQGVLTGKYEPGRPPPEDSRATSESMGRFFDYSDELLARVQQLAALAGELGISRAQLALAWVLRQPNVASAIIGASRPEQVEENAAASGIELDDATLARIDEILGDSVAWDGPAS
jgi:aryl-alcohol dehydrogenase-like predicted oxidoreductase